LARRFASSLLVALLCAATAQAGDSSFSHRVAQGSFFLEAGRPGQALIEFRAAVLTDEGRGDAEAHGLLARAAYEAGNLGEAVDAISKADALADGTLSAALAELHEHLTTRFAKVLIVGGGQPDSATIEPSSPLLDPELKRAFEAAMARLEAPAAEGSSSVYLPVGTYRLRGHLVEIHAGELARLDLRASVGAAGHGVYGERSDKRGPGARGSDKPKPPRPPIRPRRAPAPDVLPDSPGFVLGIGGHGLASQGSPTATGRLQGGVELPFSGGQGAVRVLAGFAAGRAERVFRAQEKLAPPGLMPQIGVSAGPQFALSGLILAPAAGWGVGYGGPIASLLPDGYAGPVHYLVHGPDLEVRLRFGAVGPARFEVAPRLVFREQIPLGDHTDDNRKPHVAFGGGLAVRVTLGADR